jgi:hypothetical protein
MSTFGFTCCDISQRSHSYMECDRNMALVPKKVKTEVPSDLYEVIENARVKPSPFKVVSCDQSIVKLFFKLGYVLSRAKNSGRQCHFKIWLDCHKLKKNPYLIMPMSTKCQKKREKNNNYCHTT